jgi:hypothetical protein
MARPARRATPCFYISARFCAQLVLAFFVIFFCKPVLYFAYRVFKAGNNVNNYLFVELRRKMTVTTFRVYAFWTLVRGFL